MSCYTKSDIWNSIIGLFLQLEAWISEVMFSSGSEDSTNWKLGTRGVPYYFDKEHNISKANKEQFLETRNVWQPYLLAFIQDIVNVAGL